VEELRQAANVAKISGQALVSPSMPGCMLRQRLVTWAISCRRDTTFLQPVLGLIEQLMPTVAPFAGADILASRRERRPVLSTALGTVRVGQHVNGLGEELDWI
jgi:hypothetical protein